MLAALLSSSFPFVRSRELRKWIINRGAGEAGGGKGGREKWMLGGGQRKLSHPEAGSKVYYYTGFII